MVLERREPPYLGDERSTLVGFLDYQRATLALKCEGLSDDQLRLASSPPSTLSLLGLVRHMAEVERGWMRRTVGGEDVGLVYSSGDDYEAAYDATGADPTACFAAWQAEITAGRGYADTLREAIDGSTGE